MMIGTDGIFKILFGVTNVYKQTITKGLKGDVCNLMVNSSFYWKLWTLEIGMVLGAIRIKSGSITEEVKWQFFKEKQHQKQVEWS